MLSSLEQYYIHKNINNIIHFLFGGRGPRQCLGRVWVRWISFEASLSTCCIVFFDEGDGLDGGSGGICGIGLQRCTRQLSLHSFRLTVTQIKSPLLRHIPAVTRNEAPMPQPTTTIHNRNHGIPTRSSGSACCSHENK